jgi:polyphosphate kinase
MSDGEATPDGDIDISPAAETRAEATNGQIHDAMPLVTANRDAPEGIAPAHRNGSGRHPDPDAPPPDRLTVHGLEAVDQVVSQAELGPLPPDRYLDREESWLRFNQRVLELAEDDTVPLL